MRKFKEAFRSYQLKCFQAQASVLAEDLIKENILSEETLKKEFLVTA